MSTGEFSGETDPRLANPDEYFPDKYGNIVVRYGHLRMPLATLVEMEYKVRSPEKIKAAPSEVRANRYIGMIREAGALEPVDDVVYEVPEEPK